MSAEGHKCTVAVAAGANLTSGAQYKALVVAGTIAADNTTALGILQNRPNTGEHATVAYFGHMKAFVGGAVTAGARLKVTTSGFLVAISSGDTAVARAMKAANSGSLCEVIANFIAHGQTTYS